MQERAKWTCLVQSLQNAALIARRGSAPVSNVIVLGVLTMGALQEAEYSQGTHLSVVLGWGYYLIHI